MKARKVIAIAALMLTAGVATEERLQIVSASESAGISGLEQPAHKIVQSDPIFPPPPPTEPGPALPRPAPPRPNERMRPGGQAPNFPQTDPIPGRPQKLPDGREIM